MSYDLAQFISDCRGFLKRDPGPGGRGEQVRLHLERLLNNPEFVEKYCADGVWVTVLTTIPARLLVLVRALPCCTTIPELGF